MIQFLFSICLCFQLSISQQYYDQTPCSSNTINPGTRYTCSPSSRNPCRTFFVYRANDHFATIANISNMFGINPDTLLSINNNVSTSNQILEPGHEVLVPILCSCSGNFSQADFSYRVIENATLSSISCGVFEGLVKSITLAEENLLPDEDVLVRGGSTLRVPLKCACPDRNRGVKYLVTYPFVERDNTKKLGEKFNVSVEEIWRVNHLDPMPTVYPNTTVLVPLRDEPLLNFSFPDTDPPSPPFLPTKPFEKKPKISRLNNIYIVGFVLTFSLILALLISCGLYIKALKKFEAENVPSLNRISSMNSCSTPRSSPFSRSSMNSCLSPDLLVGIKYSLSNYAIEDLKQSTNSFREDSKINDNLYKGLIDNGEVMIKRMRFEGTKQVIDVHSKINHVNIVKLHGVCYGDDEHSYLVYEYPLNGSLRDYLSSSSGALHWHRRTQIAFDIATGLHYLHYSVIRACTHLTLNSKNIFLTSNFRAKITVFGTKESLPGGWIAPEYVRDGIMSEKVDIFAFGVVLLELISGNEDGDGKLVRESVTFLGGERGNEGGCFDQLRGFVDPCLKDDYPLAEALCLAVLAGSCVEDDPMHRPSMEDVLKILARMV